MHHPTTTTTMAATATETNAMAATGDGKAKLISVLSSFHAGYFRISLSLSGQALLWKTLTTTSSSSPSPILRFLPSTASIFLWSLSAATLLSLSLLFLLRCLLRFPSVRSEFSHHVGVNYLFAPWISSLLLLLSSPFASTTTAAAASTPGGILLLLLFSLPIVALDVKIYGQCFTAKSRKFLSMVANPTCQLSVIGNLAGAMAAAEMGWRESAVFLFALGMAHYVVLFVTLYQRFVGSDRLPAMLRPVFFLLFAAPGMASLAWDSIAGSFDVGSKMLFFLSLFLFASLVLRPAMFKRSMRKFSVAWWAYSFPLTVLALASTEYAQEVKGAVANALMLALSVLSVLVSFVLILFTALCTGAILPRDDPFMVVEPIDIFTSPAGTGGVITSNSSSSILDSV